LVRFIDEILTGKYIVSESLYCLIVSEPYVVPNLWIKIKLDWKSLKFHKWFLSFGVNRDNQFEISKSTNTKDLIHELKYIYI